jgi:tetratricopeptide (TPR) repeat protein
VLQAGVVAAAVLVGGRLADRPPREEDPVEQPPWVLPQVRPEARRPPARTDLDEADLLIRSGRFELALGICKPAADVAAAELRDAFGYRMGLSLEGLGRFDEAVTAYRVVAGRARSSFLASAAQLGQARAWLRMRRPAAGKVLLADLLLRSGDPALRGHALLGDARYLLALALSLEALGVRRAGIDSDAPVTHTSSDWSLDRALTWSDLSRPVKSPAPPPARPDVVLVRRVGAGEADVVVAAAAWHTPVNVLLAQVAGQAGLRLEWSPRARDLAEGRTLHVLLDPLPLPDFLRAVGERLGLSWQVAQGKLVLRAETETADASPSHLREQARRALGEAVLHYPRHPLTPVAYLELGNLEAEAGRPSEAAAWYGRLAREWSRSTLVAEALYNRGLVEKRAGQTAAARQSFYAVVDRAPAGELAPLAYFHVGRLHLDDGQPEQALSPLRRAMLSANGAAVQPAAALALAAAHLLGGNPRAANRVILEHRGRLSAPEYLSAATFLDTLARFRAATLPRQKQRETGDLLTCLLTFKDDGLLGPAGVLLRAQAYHDAGMHELLVAFGSKALPELRGPAAVEMAATLADACYALDQRPRAARLYARAADGPTPRAVRARQRLAEIALQQGNAPECLKWCERLLQDGEAVDPREVLRIMAKAYELAGQRDKAIRCLSGKRP